MSNREGSLQRGDASGTKRPRHGLSVSSKKMTAVVRRLSGAQGRLGAAAPGSFCASPSSASPSRPGRRRRFAWSQSAEGRVPKLTGICLGCSLQRSVGTSRDRCKKSN